MINKIKRRFVKELKLRPSSEPFISGDTFRKLANYIYEENNKNFNSEDVKDKDIIFVQSHLLKEFFETCHNKIRNKYILISHNADTNITKEYLKYIDSKIIKWYAQNLLIEHEKLEPIPIGLENMSYYTNGIVSKYKKSANNKPMLNKILVGFSIHTNKVKREPCFNSLSLNECSTVINKYIRPNEYFKLLKQHKFVASPEGNGIDCHRMWEAMYMGVVPIVLKNTFTDKFNELPIWIIDSWEELRSYDTNELDKKYNNLIKCKSNKCFFNYYKQLIMRNVNVCQ